MAKGLSATQRTLRELRRQGRICDVAEKWQMIPGHPAGGFRKDLFGWVDIVALDPERGFVGVQSCGQSFAAHLRDMLQNELVLEWLRTPGGSAELWGWRKVKLHRGGKAMRWAPRVREITQADFLVDDDKNGGATGTRP